MIQIQGTSKLLSYEMKETPTNGRKKSNHDKLRSQFKSVVARAIMCKIYERNRIYKSCSLQSKQIIAIMIILFIVLNVDL